MYAIRSYYEISCNDHRREGVLERHGLGSQVDEDEALPLGDPGLVERIARLVEAFHLLHVGRADQPAVGGPGPGMIGTLDRLGEVAGRLLIV